MDQREFLFQRADMNVDLMHDPKVVRLARLVNDEARTFQALSLYIATVLLSWKEGRRVPIEEAQPAWSMTPVAAIREVLHQVGLLDEAGSVPEESWEVWFGSARDRVQRASEIGRLGAATRWGKPPPGGGPDASAMPLHKGANADAMHHTNSTNSTNERTGVGKPTPRAREEVYTARDCYAEVTGRSTFSANEIDYLDRIVKRWSNARVIAALRSTIVVSHGYLEAVERTLKSGEQRLAAVEQASTKRPEPRARGKPETPRELWNREALTLLRGKAAEA